PSRPVTRGVTRAAALAAQSGVPGQTSEQVSASDRGPRRLYAIAAGKETACDVRPDVQGVRMSGLLTGEQAASRQAPRVKLALRVGGSEVVRVDALLDTGSDVSVVSP